jgi:hypothetical protein
MEFCSGLLPERQFSHEGIVSVQQMAYHELEPGNLT